MQEASKTTLCPGVTQTSSELCENSGHDLHSMRLAKYQAQPTGEFYAIVPDGELYAIAVQGEIEVDGLDSSDLPKAQTIVEILNNFIEAEKVG